MKRLFLALVLILGLGTLAYAAGAKFTIDKKLCLGSPTSMADPALCQEMDPAPQNVPVYYMISLTNPWSQPPQAITLSDPMPPQFSQSGAMFCRDQNNLPIIPLFSSGNLGLINLAPAQTVNCFVPGTFTSDGKPKNKVTGTNTDNYSSTADVTTNVPKSTPIGANLSITKTVTPGAINVASGAQTVTYTIKIKNNGPGDVTVGDWFKLHDVMSLLPSSVPLNVKFLQATCSVSSSASDCLDASNPNFGAGSANLFVGTMNKNAFFEMDFGSSQGTIKQGDTITITVDVAVYGVDGMDCVRQPGGNGLTNTAFFTMTNSSGTALADGNLADNSASANLGVTVPYSTVDPTCATDLFKLTKVQTSPANPNIQVSWGTPVTYAITIENVALPAQTIKIKKHDFQDLVSEGVDTPPFTRTHVSTSCDQAASSPGQCANFTPTGTGLNISGPHGYTYYGETNLGWDNDDDIKLKTGEKIVFKTTFIYDQPDCETVPAAPKRPIINTATVTYIAPPFGAPSGTPDVATYQVQTATTLMKEQPPCKFKVTKQLVSGGPNVTFGGPPLKYVVTFTNQGDPRKIGTLFDAARITIPNYATQLPFTSTWQCTPVNGGNGAPSGYGALSGSVMAGAASYAASGAQGAPAAIATLGSNIYFPTNASFSCTIKVVIQRPPLGDPFCTRDDAYFENVAMMDVTSPFNTNITWPPALGWLNASMANPTPQDKNYASYRALLPKCWDAHVNKSVTVGGLPAGSKPWTYPGNTHSVDYTISVTNDAKSPLGTATSPGSGWIVQDKFAPPYASGTQIFTGCSPAWCWTLTPPPPHDPRGEVGIKNGTATLAAGLTGTWAVKQPPSAIQPGQDLINCAWIKPVGAQTGPGWYNNRFEPVPSFNCIPTANKDCPAIINPLFACVKVPVLEVTKISVRKRVVDQTGSGVTAASGFGITVGCTPYGIPTSAPSSFTLATNSTGYSAYSSVYPVPLGGTCTVTETASPIPAAIAQRCGGAGNVSVATSITPLPAALNPIDNQVTVTNTYSCKGKPAGQLEVIKVLNTIAHPVQFPATTWTIQTNCSPAGSSGQLSITTPASGNAQITASGMVTAPVGANCAVSEQTPAVSLIPAWFQSYCASAAQGSGTAVWNVPEYSINNGPYSTTAPTVAITAGVTTVRVKNGWHCVPGNSNVPTGQLEVIKVLNTIAHPVQFPATTWTIQTNCIPAGSASLLNITTPASGNAQITASGMVTAGVGANCAVSEQTPAVSLIPAWFQSYCASAAQGSGTAVWNVPEYSINNGPYSTTAPSVAITAGVTTVRVKNGWHCVPSTTPTVNYQFQVFKRVVGPTTQVPPMTFQIVSNCLSPATPPALSVTTSYPHTSFVGAGAFTVPSGSTCNLSEVLPNPTQIPAMVAFCSAQTPNIEPKWLPPVWSTSSTGTPVLNLPVTANASLNLFIVNSWICTTPATAKVAPKPKRKPKIRINIGIGSILGGGSKPRDPPQPGDNGPPRP